MTVHVVGAGLAGLAAATALSERGTYVRVWEASAQGDLNGDGTLFSQLARTGDMMRAAAEYDRLAERIESTGEDPDDAAERLRTRARSLRARLN